MKKTKTYLQIILMLGLLVMGAGVSGQTPFSRKGQIFQVFNNTNELATCSAIPNYNVVQSDVIGTLPAPLNALGFRKTDNFLYGVGQTDNHVYKIGDNSTYLDLGTAGLDNSLLYKAGDISPDGKYLVCVGNGSTGLDVQIAIIDLESSPLAATFVPLSATLDIADVAFDIYTGKLYGYDNITRKIITINYSTGSVNTAFQPIFYENQLSTLYFDAFGDLYGYGTAVNGIVSGLFLINKANGKETLLATGPNESILDGASCPYSVAIKSEMSPVAVLPCSPFTIHYTIANGSGETITGVDFEHDIPTGFHLSSVLSNPFGVPVDTQTVPGAILLQQFDIGPGKKTLSLKMNLDDLPKGNYRSQTAIKQLPALYGNTVLSDDPETAGFPDSSTLRINRFDEDTITNRWLICYGEVQELNAADYGDQIKWNNGSTNSIISVNATGMYALEAGNACEFVVVTHDVTAVSCPFTIEIDHKIVPKDTFYACKEVVFRYYVRNDSGEDRFDIHFADTLPAGFTLVSVLNNPYGGNLVPGATPNIVNIQGMQLLVGEDSIDLLVNLGAVSPGTYKNRAYIRNLPRLMGPFRMSDNPSTPFFDSTAIVIKGPGEDSLMFEKQKCTDVALVLDASDLGETFLWEDGSNGPRIEVTDAGDYHLILLDGCEPIDIFYHVVDGGAVKVPEAGPFAIHQGEKLEMGPPYYIAGGDTTLFRWLDTPSGSLSCLDCPEPVAIPLENTIYNFWVSNGICSDSVEIQVSVDETRRIYTGNIFSPDDDGENDFFFLQSPDAALIRSFRVMDRWGSVVYEMTSGSLNEENRGWNGDIDGRPAPAGVYIWAASIEFPDGERKVLKGDVTVIR